ncbi:MAG TPA: nucleotidyltransferase family protein [Candidatus Alectryocaccomicrobium excrementavium]|uniref:Nucleotidyltransferase family protein n=1 Tax=Candidatus Alectryocaccomicrobium excrementavium TaxID=2840668 RepID=A0A9D1K8I1_9FIRM|nr:nucleotidyltransferase family protein [Candidatus Alectryocaccomicrobium excrementavium]
MKAIILAAGYATRLYPLTKDMPKALLPVAGRTILDRLLDGMRAIPEMDHIHLVTNHRFAPAFEKWRQAAQTHCPITVHDDGTISNEDRLGAVGDIAFVLERARIDDDLFVAASDNLFTFPLSDFAADFRRHGRDLLLGTRIDDVDTLRRYAVATLDGENRVLSLVEKPQEPQSHIGICAIYLYRRDTVPLFPAMISEYRAAGKRPDAPGYFAEWLCKRKEVRVYLAGGECVDIGTVESYREVCGRWTN